MLVRRISSASSFLTTRDAVTSSRDLRTIRLVTLTAGLAGVVATCLSVLAEGSLNVDGKARECDRGSSCDDDGIEDGELAADVKGESIELIAPEGGSKSRPKECHWSGQSVSRLPIDRASLLHFSNVKRFWQGLILNPAVSESHEASSAVPQDEDKKRRKQERKLARKGNLRIISFQLTLAHG